MNKEAKLTARGESMLREMNAHVQRRLANKLAKFEGRSDAQAKSEKKKAYEKYVLKSILVKGASCQWPSEVTHQWSLVLTHP